MIRDFTQKHFLFIQILKSYKSLDDLIEIVNTSFPNVDFSEVQLSEIEPDLKNIKSYLTAALDEVISFKSNNQFPLLDKLMNEYIHPTIKTNPSSLKIELSVCNPPPSDDILGNIKWHIGKEIFDLSSHSLLTYIKKCISPECNNIFISQRFDGKYCSPACKRHADYNNNRDKYLRRLQLRRLPKHHIICIQCRRGIKLPLNDDGSINRNEEGIQCKFCKTVSVNPYFAIK